MPNMLTKTQDCHEMTSQRSALDDLSRASCIMLYAESDGNSRAAQNQTTHIEHENTNLMFQLIEAVDKGAANTKVPFAWYRLKRTF